MTAAGLVGRESELAVVDRLLDAVDAGTGPGILQVLGEPGIGKSRLLAELGARARQRRHLVLSGRSAEFERDVPFGVFVAALDDHLASLGAADLDGLDPQWYAELATAFPAFVPLAGDRPVGIQAERYRTYRAVRALLHRLGQDRPLVVILDDLQWADAASVELLGHLAVHHLRAAVLLAVAFRPAQAPTALARILTDAAREGSSTCLSLSPLSRAQAAELVGGALPPAAAEQLYDESGGNPFYLEQLLRARTLARPAEVVDLSPAAVPAGVAAALAAELASLPAPARTLLEGAAVAGDPLDPDLAALAGELEDQEAAAALDELVTRDVLRPTSVPRRLRFRHPILRRAVYESSGTGWRARAHRRVTEELRRRGAAPAALASHVERSAEWGDLEAVNVLVEAGHATSLRAPATAAQWYEAALHLLPDTDAELGQRLQLLLASAGAWAGAGQLEDAHRALCDALGRLPDGAEGRLAIVAFCAGVETLLNRHQQARARLLDALAAVGDSAGADVAALRVEIAIGAIYEGDYAGAATNAEAAVETAEGTPQLRAAAAAALSIAQCYLGRISDAQKHLSEASRLFDGLNDRAVGQRLDASYLLAWGDSCLGRYSDAVRHAERGIAVARATGQGHILVPIMFTKAWALTFSGRLAEAVELAKATIDAASVGHVEFHVLALWDLCFAACRRGDLATAIQAGEKAVELAAGPLESTVATAASGVLLG
ncbi:MAG: AAA family ATPase, partial [Actinomycetota bacterium]|nr:AAA family ATPase [Actinomycetota bacterium]